MKWLTATRCMDMLVTKDVMVISSQQSAFYVGIR